MVTSPRRQGLIRCLYSTWVPVSHKASTRACGKAPPHGRIGACRRRGRCPGYRAGSGRSRQVPSGACRSRRRRECCWGWRAGGRPWSGAGGWGRCQGRWRLTEGVAMGSDASAETLEVLVDLAVGVLGEEAQPEDDIDHEPVGQAGAVAAAVAGRTTWSVIRPSGGGRGVVPSLPPADAPRSPPGARRR